MVMCICLLVYSVTQRKLRNLLKENKEFVPHQTGKPTQTPTLKWVFQLFHCIHVIYQKFDDGIKIAVSNLTDLRRTIQYH
jgi:transposase